MSDWKNAPPPEFPENLEGGEDFGPNPEPLTVPPGTYLCQFAGSVIKRTSRWGEEGSFYYELPLKIKDAEGNTFEFKFNFSNPKNQIYAEMGKLAGGKELPSRVVELPPKNDIIGKLFMAQIVERPMKNDKTKLTNDIFRVWAYEPKSEPEPEPEAQIEAKNPDVSIEKEFPKSEEEEKIPF